MWQSSGDPKFILKRRACLDGRTETSPQYKLLLADLPPGSAEGVLDYWAGTGKAGSSCPNYFF